MYIIHLSKQLLEKWLEGKMTYTHILVLFSGQKRCNINYTNHVVLGLLLFFLDKFLEWSIVLVFLKEKKLTMKHF